MPDSLTQLGVAVSRQATAPAKLTHGSLFTGVGGMDLGLDVAGFETVWQVEKNPYCLKVLKKHWPKVPKFTDVRKCGKHNLEPVDIISGGYPCQDHSIAGKKRGLGTPDNPTGRSGLWFEYLRIVRELRPRWVLIENVSRLLLTADGDTVLSDMEGIGYSCRSLVVGADKLGAPHKRERAWILCRRNEPGRTFDFKAANAEQWVLAPECRVMLSAAKEIWDYWKRELAGPKREQSDRVTTPTATEILEPEWLGARLWQAASGRPRKLMNNGSDSSMSWILEMAVRALAQKNDNLTPTPGKCEEFMGFPTGWTDLGTNGDKDAAWEERRRKIFGPRYWRERFTALGNAVAPQIPMLFGCFIQECESRLSLAAHAGVREFKEDAMSEKISAHDMPEPQTHAESARVDGGYESLDVNSTKKAYEELNGVLGKLATTAVQTLDQMIPYLAKMQSLLSQRGSDRKKVLQQAELPGWTHWAKAYASKLDRSVRTIQDRIKQFRGPQAGGTTGPTGKTKSGNKGERLKLDSRQQAALVRAQVVANDLVAALKNGADWETPLAEYEKVAVTPAKLDTFMNALSPEPDWKSILKQLVDTLEQCGGELPIPVMNALHAVQKLLDSKPDERQLPSGKGKAAVTKQDRVQKHRKDGSTCCVVPGEEMPSGDAQKPPALVKGTACLAVWDPEEERIHGTLGAASGHPGRRQGDFVLKENGKWECEPEVGMFEAEEIRDAQPGEQQLPPINAMATAAKPCHVKKRVRGDIVHFLVVRDGDSLAEEVFNTKGEAEAFCEKLNAPRVAGIVPPVADPRSAAQSSAY